MDSCPLYHRSGGGTTRPWLGALRPVRTLLGRNFGHRVRPASSAASARPGYLGYDGRHTVLFEAVRLHQKAAAARYARPAHGARSQGRLRLARVSENHGGGSVSKNDLPRPTLAG